MEVIKKEKLEHRDAACCVARTDLVSDIRAVGIGLECLAIPGREYKIWLWVADQWTSSVILVVLGWKRVGSYQPGRSGLARFTCNFNLFLLLLEKARYVP